MFRCQRDGSVACGALQRPIYFTFAIDPKRRLPSSHRGCKVSLIHRRCAVLMLAMGCYGPTKFARERR